MEKQANDHNKHGNHSETSQIRVLILDYPKPIQEGIYDVAVNNIYMSWEPSEGYILMVGLTILDEKDFVPHFVAIMPLNDNDNNYHICCVVSTIIGYKVENSDFNDLFGLLGRRAKVHVLRSKNGKRVISVVPRWWDGEIPEYARWVEYVPSDDIE